MRLSAVPSTVLELVGLGLGLVPLPLLHTQAAYTQARAIMAASELGVFDALNGGPRTLTEIAGCCNTALEPTARLLDALVGLRYLTFRRRDQTYRLRRIARRYLVSGAPFDLRDKLRFQREEWNALAELEQYVRTGRALDIHQNATPAQWTLYQRAMRATGRLVAVENARRAPVPANATRMLDIGGGGGAFAAALCRRYPALHATILELPEACNAARLALEDERMGSRVEVIAGDARTADLGDSRYDFVLLSNLAHHLSNAENRAVSRRVGRALRPGGVFAINEFVRPHQPSARDSIGSLMGLYFGLTSRSGCWSLEELRTWQRDADLEPLRPLRFRLAPGFIQQAARRPFGSGP